MYEGTTARAIDCRNLIPVAIWSCALHQLRTAERRSPFLSRHLAFQSIDLVLEVLFPRRVLLAKFVFSEALFLVSC